MNTVLIPQRQEAPCHFDGTPKPMTCDCRFDTNHLGTVNHLRHTRWLSCFDSYIMRSPLPKKLITPTRIGFLVGGQWGSENSWVSELRVLTHRTRAAPAHAPHFRSRTPFLFTEHLRAPISCGTGTVCRCARILATMWSLSAGPRALHADATQPAGTHQQSAGNRAPSRLDKPNLLRQSLPVDLSAVRIGIADSFFSPTWARLIL